MVTRADLEAQVGVAHATAAQTLTAQFPAMLVVAVPNDAMVTADYRTDRLRVWYDPTTGLVTEVING